ncbi:mechanosensitive ion channel domain-containing protein [uncultured Phenylobacterium sp.]|uniref:mechanosensitive ion channel family protein n=1 Tax=uncultured Phenylobacterium sp. TaxID=349273 RepID=UPI0025EE02E2|nr:mechanosensitive ion channel domain-containing protein [uncultured Phenylobacterium sp.]
MKPSLAEQLIAFGREAWAQMLQLDASEAGLNLMLSAAVLLVAGGLIWVLRRLFDGWIARFVANAPGKTEDDAKRTPKAAGVTWTLVRLSVLAMALLLVVAVWGIDPWTWLSGEAGARLVRLALVAGLATALVEVTGFVIRRLIEGFARRSADRRRAAQLRTLAPLLTGCAQGVLIVIGLLTFLAELGLKVGPILASAGVVGIAVGFGAQTLVKDFLTGLFLIAEDVVSVGDNVGIGNSSGVVEMMTMRTIRLRDANGTLHIFPYSEAQVIHNHTKVFSSYVVEIPVSYDSDVDQALGILRALGEEMQRDAAFANLITRPFEVMGVDRLTENAVYLKARFTTEPRAQWQVGREFNRRLKNAFDAAGISTPAKTVPITPQSLDEQRAAREH